MIRILAPCCFVLSAGELHIPEGLEYDGDSLQLLQTKASMHQIQMSSQLAFVFEASGEVEQDGDPLLLLQTKALMHHERMSSRHSGTGGCHGSDCDHDYQSNPVNTEQVTAAASTRPQPAPGITESLLLDALHPHQALSFFQKAATVSAANTTDDEELPVAKPVHQDILVAADMQYTVAAALVAAVMITFSVFSYWAFIRSAKSRSTPSVPGALLQTSCVIELAIPEEPYQSNAWSARVFSTPMRDAFGLSVLTEEESTQQ